MDFIQQELDRINQEIEENKTLLESSEFKSLAENEIMRLEKQKRDLIESQQQVENDNQDSDETGGGPKNKNVAILEFRAAAGGEEAKLWADDLARMYTRFANTKGWKITTVDDGVIKLKGKGVYTIFQYEAGVHRVQRVPTTESQGRIHTSTATVAVLPEIKPTELNIDEKDIEFVSFRRSSGAGGQNVNKVATAVRLTHTPTAITVESSQERSQIQNREVAMQLLAGKLWELEEERRLEELGDARLAIGRGMRAEKIRTFNYPQNRVTDHRVGKSWQELDLIIEGKLDKVLKAVHEYFSEESK